MFFTITIIVIFIILILLCCKILKKMKKYYKQKKNYIGEIKDEIKEDPFVISFKKTRTESLIISRVEEIQKQRDIQFVISFYNYKDEKKLKGSLYIVTSKIVYKIIFIKYNLVTILFHQLNTFIDINNIKYKDISNYLNLNYNCQKQKHHDEFYNWSYYFFVNDYEKEQEKWEKFIKNF